MCLFVSLPIIFLMAVLIACKYWGFVICCALAEWWLIELTFDKTVIFHKNDDGNNIKL